MHKLNLSTIDAKDITNILRTHIELLPEGEILMVEDKQDRESILESLRKDAYNTLTWYGFMESDQHWVAHVRKMSEEHCCGSCGGQGH